MHQKANGTQINWKGPTNMQSTTDGFSFWVDSWHYFQSLWIELYQRRRTTMAGWSLQYTLHSNSQTISPLQIKEGTVSGYLSNHQFYLCRTSPNWQHHVNIIIIVIIIIILILCLITVVIINVITSCGNNQALLNWLRCSNRHYKKVEVICTNLILARQFRYHYGGPLE